MFCIKCGKAAFFDNFCEECYLKGKELFTVKEVKIRYCSSCKQFYTQREKISEEKLENFIATLIKTKNRIKSTGIKMDVSPGKIRASVTTKGFIRPSRKILTETKELVLRPKKMKCAECVKLLGGYYEALVQIRGPKGEKILAKVKQLLPPTEVASINALKEGYDIRVVNKSAAGKSVQALREKFSIKQSFKLVGEKKGRKLYRNVYSVR